MNKSLQRSSRPIMSVYKSLPEGTLAELINGIIYMSLAPDSLRALILNDIDFQFTCQLDCNARIIYIAPYDVSSFEEKIKKIAPDVPVMLLNYGSAPERKYFGENSDFLIEILPPGTNDLIRKKDIYERFGVKEYWAVDPESKLALGFSLYNQKYQLISEDIGLLKSPLLGISIRF